MKAREEERRDDTIYRLYVTDSLFYMNQNMRLVEKYTDILKRNRKERQPQKTGDEIVKDMLNKHGLKFKKGGDSE